MKDELPQQNQQAIRILARHLEAAREAFDALEKRVIELEKGLVFSEPRPEFRQEYLCTFSKVEKSSVPDCIKTKENRKSFKPADMISTPFVKDDE